MKTQSDRQAIAYPTIWTVGHSTRSAEEFNQILAVHKIRGLADVRSLPGSRRHPQFNKAELSESLAARGITYLHLPALGGRRRPLSNSRNTAWRNSSFRAYADYMETVEFEQGIQRLLELARANTTAIMCAEALWWRCHRSLIADYLKVQDATVLNIIDEKTLEVHPYTSAAAILNGKLSYAGLLVGET